MYMNREETTCIVCGVDVHIHHQRGNSHQIGISSHRFIYFQLPFEATLQLRTTLFLLRQVLWMLLLNFLVCQRPYQPCICLRLQDVHEWIESSLTALTISIRSLKETGNECFFFSFLFFFKKKGKLKSQIVWSQWEERHPRRVREV